LARTECGHEYSRTKNIALWRAKAERQQRNNMAKRKPNREFGVGARIVVNHAAPGGYFARLGTVREIVLDSRYGVTFDNQKGPTVYLDAECLDPIPQEPKRN
jgi:hypothetical protein